MQEERRKNIRIDQKLTIVPWPSKKIIENPSVSKDISTGGVRLLTHEKMPLGTILELGIYLPEFKKPLIVKGEVLALEELENAMFGYMARIKFVEVDYDTRLQLLSHIQYCVLRV